ncbi:hypothetical protein SBOR_3177 [Sclerotinia borealis F-4128]|uniref:Fungal N-terminal domain-containing protein n=1 Tax=Sclerotinia borealis (strain F-4128) TaxID=1432307 RepID=W9CPM6_SCLBF|nr:hypothetical protein SBOR_3177 [Sclerotinia borealis F-4128]
MDPIKILGAASSAVGIASFGIQLIQVLTKYANDASSAAQNLRATLTNIRAASNSIEQINIFLKEESERVVKQRQKATLLSIEGIRKFQQTTDDCLKIFWRVEAWVLNKDDSPDLEIKIKLRLCEYKEELRANPGKHPKLLKVDEALAKVRKFKESRLARYINPLGEHKLDRYSKELQRLQVSLNVFFSILNIRAVQNQPALSSNGSLIAHMYNMARHDAQQAQYTNIELCAEPQQNHSVDYEFHSGARDWETNRLNTGFMPLLSRTQYIPGRNEGVPYIDSSYTGTGWPQIPPYHVAHSEIHPRDPPNSHRFLLPAVPDDPWKLFRQRTHVENEDAVIDAAENHMAHFDAKARRKFISTSTLDNDDTKIYPGELNADERSRKDHKDESRHQKQKERENSKSGKSTPSHRSGAPWSERGGVSQTAVTLTPLVEYGFDLAHTSGVSKPEIQTDDIDEIYTISDLRKILKITVPFYTRVLEDKQPQSEVSMEPKSPGSALKYKGNDLSHPIEDTFGDRDLSDVLCIYNSLTNP